MNALRTILFLFVGFVPLTVLGEGSALVHAGSVWKYHDRGLNLGTLWVSPNYDDSQWASGRAQLGYGEGDEATVVNSGPVGAHYITTYFRHTFVVTNASVYTNLTLRLLRDDGAVVYLNGLEFVRVGIAPGPVNYQTLASSAAIEGSLFVTPFLNPGILLEGVNVLAVEIHQASVSSTDISFDLELVNDEPLAMASFVDLPPNAVFASPTKLSLSAKAATPGGVTSLKFYVNNSEIDQRSMFSRLYATFNRDFTTPSNYSLAVAAFDSRGFSKTSVVEVVVEPPPAQTTTLVGTGATWRFLDDGSELGTEWRVAGYDDQTWNAGPAALGYGKAGLATIVRSNRLDGSRITTTWLRRTWAHPDGGATFRKLALRVLGDDGTKVYLNGREVFRNNLPSDPVGTSTPALEVTDPVAFTSGALIDPSLLFTGTNLLAAEVHQAPGGPADLIFDLELVGLSDPRLSIQLAADDSVLLSWPYPSMGYGLSSTPGFAPAEWSDVTNSPVHVGNNFQVTVPKSARSRFFRLFKAN